MKKQLTAEQIQKRDARRAKFKEMWKQVAAIPETQRVLLAAKYGFRKAKDASEFSPANTMLIALQCPQATVLAGFRDWMKLGRCVRKGEHGVMIFVPMGHKAKDVSAEGVETEHTEKTGFITGTVFDISQTQEVETAVEPTVEQTAILQPVFA